MAYSAVTDRWIEPDVINWAILGEQFPELRFFHLRIGAIVSLKAVATRLVGPCPFAFRKIERHTEGPQQTNIPERSCLSSVTQCSPMDADVAPAHCGRTTEATRKPKTREETSFFIGLLGRWH